MASQLGNELTLYGSFIVCQYFSLGDAVVLSW